MPLPSAPAQGTRSRGALIIQPRLGLANRLRAVASAAVTATHAGRTLFLDWTADERCHAAWGDLFENELPAFPGAIPGESRTYREVSDNFSRPGPGDAVDAPEKVVLVSTHFNFKPPLMSMAQFLAAKAAFYRGLVPVPVVREQLCDLRARGLRDRNMVGVHIRRGDLQLLTVDPPDYVSPTSLFTKHMRKLLDKAPDTRFFLATDDLREQERIVAEFPGRVLHQAKARIVRHEMTGIQQALVDWLALAETGRILHSHLSSFSREAAVAGGVPAIAVKRLLWPYSSYRKWIHAGRTRLRF